MKGRRGRPRGPTKPYTVVMEDYETVCRICEAEFLDEEDLKMHIRQMHLNGTGGRMLCKVCHVLLPGAEMFASHFIVKHLETSAFCFYCYRNFSDPLLLDQHELKHRAVADDTAVSCSQCSAILVDRYKLQDHEYQEHSNVEDGLLLNAFFPLLSAELNMNVKKFIDCVSKKMALVCTCKYATSNLNNYITHLITSNCECVVCDKCCNIYKRKNSIMTHFSRNPQCQNIVNNVILKKPCLKCNKYINPTEFNAHVSMCNILKCGTCDKSFASINELTEHRVTKHVSKISLVTCKICQKQFVGKLTLQKHMTRTHKNKRQYKYNCVHCGCVFPHPQRLFAHFFTKHKDLQPYTCTICQLKFRLRKHFTFHIKLKHESNGYVEFDKNLHVIFTANKSENPVSPKANIDQDSTTDASDIDNDGNPNDKLRVRTQSKARDADKNIDQITTPTDSTDPEISKDKSQIEPVHTVDIVAEQVDDSDKKNRRSRSVKQLETMIVDNSDELSNDSDEEPLSKIKDSLLREKSNSTLNRKNVNKDKRAKLTCKICKKYCYTVQYYHHHLTLHEKSKMKRCIKCNEYFKTRRELQTHIDSAHTSSKLIETLKSVMEKRKKVQPVKPAQPAAKPADILKSILEKRKEQQSIMKNNNIASKFRRTIQKVECDHQCEKLKATITPLSEHGLSVKNFIENFKPDGDSVNISNSVTLKAVDTPVTKAPIIKMRPFNPSHTTFTKLRSPVKFKDTGGPETKISVKLVQQLVTKPKAINMVYNELVPMTEKTEPDEYRNMFADETDYTQYKNDSIPEVAQEVMLGDPEDVPHTRRLAREIYIPKIPEEHGGVRIGHLLPDAPFYKIVEVKKLLDAVQDQEPKPPQPVNDKDVKLPDGTRLISVKNPYAHLIATEHLEEILKANRSKYYTPKTKNIGKAIAKALNPTRPARKSRRKKES